MIRFTLLLLLPLVISVIAQNGYNPSRRSRPLPVLGRPRPFKPVASVTQPPVPAVTQPPAVAATQPPAVAATQPPAVAATQPLAVDAIQPPAVAATQPPAVTATQPPAVAATQPSAVAATQPPAVVAIQPPAVAATQPPAVAATQPPAVAATQPPAVAATQPPAVVQPVPLPPPATERQPLVPAVASPPQTEAPKVPLEPKEEKAGYEPIPKPVPELESRLKAEQAAEAAPKPKPHSYPLKLRPQINFVVVPQTTTNPVAVKPAPVVLPPLLPKPNPVREPVFGRQTIPTTRYPITVSTQRVTKAPPVIITTSTTQRPGSLKLDVCMDGNGYYAVANECDSYIECKYNKATQRWCPDGLHFNPAAKRYEYPCAYPSLVKCTVGNERQNPRPTAQCPRQYGFYSTNDGDCSKYIVCQEGAATIMNCPSGLVFNPTVQSCDWVEKVPQCNPNVFKDYVCPQPPIDEDGLVSDIIYKYRYEQHCKFYVACQRGYPRLLSCDQGLSFDENSQSCVDEEYVQDCAAPRS